MKSPRLVLVEWDDAYSQSHWYFDSEIESKFLDGGYHCQIVGWMIRDSRDGIVIAARRSVVNGSYGLLQFIPRGMVQKVTKLDAKQRA